MADLARHDNDSYRLRNLSAPIQDESNNEVYEEPPTQRLPPVDGGRAAWLFLTGCFAIEMVLWGFPFSFGVLQEYYSTHPPISSNPSSISAVGTTCSGILYLFAPFTFLHCTLSTHARRYSLFYALPLLSLSLIASSYARTVSHLILTQGLLYALSGCYLYYPIFLWVDEWFVRRKALAYGIMWAGSGCGGLVGPFVLSWGLKTYGAPTFLRGWAIAMFLLIGPLLFFVKPRLPDPLPTSSISLKQTLRNLTHGFSFARTREFALLQAANTMQGLGYFIPLLYLPTYAATHHLPSSMQSLLLSLINLATIPGLLFLTALSDHSISAYTLILISALGSCLATFLLWGLASASLPLLILFSVAYGFFGGGFTAVYAATAKELQTVMIRRRGEAGLAGADVGSIFGLLGVGRGIGNVIAGPLSEVLLKGDVSMGGYGSGYRPLVIFTGTTAAAAAVTATMRWAGVWRRL